MASRTANENRFKQWSITENKGRLYCRKVIGKQEWYALYYKEVNANEETIRIWQEIYNSNNQLIEIHYKYPEDKGHQKIK